MIHYPRWKVLVTILIVLLGLLFASPNISQIRNIMPSWLPHEKVNLGLDLRGGSYILLKVDTKSIIAERFQGTKDEIRTDLLTAKLDGKSKRIGFIGGVVSNSSGINVKIAKEEDLDRAVDIIKKDSKDMDVEVVKDTTIHVSLGDVLKKKIQKQTVDQSIEIIRRRIDPNGTLEPIIQQVGNDRINLQIPGETDPARIKNLLGKTAKLTFHLVNTNVSASGIIPPDSMLLDDADTGTKTVVYRKVEVSGANLVKAEPSMQQNAPVVAFEFDSLGAKKFYNITAQNIGHRLAIVLDNKVISSPNINGAINGSGIIQGHFTVESANNLSILLRAGALPAPLDILDERTVGPSLGQDSIVAGAIASLVGFGAVIVFMLITYGLFGLYANVALIVNIVLILGVLSMLQATLTLPGIAGIVLTIGMAVDANVLIYERIREEIKEGQKPYLAIKLGYEHAFTTILDANLTTLIATLLLYNFGSGAVRGFAVTLSIGVVTSMFAALMVTRLIVYKIINATKPTKINL